MGELTSDMIEAVGGDRVGRRRRVPRAVTMPVAYEALWPTGLPWKPKNVTAWDALEDGYVDIGMTEAAVFDLFSSARSAPSSTFWVSTTGSDTNNNGTSQGTAFATIDKAIQAAVATGNPCKIITLEGTYYFPGTVTDITVDIAFEAIGRVNYGLYSNFTAPTVDGTYANTYSAVLQNVDNVFDRLNVDEWGNSRQLMLVGSADICNRTPGSWFYDTANNRYYINRADGAAPVVANTRVMRGASHAPFSVRSTPVSVFFGPHSSSPNGGYDIEGSGNYPSGLSYQPTSLAASYKAVVAHQASMRYTGGRTVSSASGVGFNGLHGIALLSKCYIAATAADCFTARRTVAYASKMVMVTLNCTGVNPGMSDASLSNNGFTLHNDCMGIDFGGYYSGGRGGTIRCIDDTKTWIVSTVIRWDRGDQYRTAGTTPPSLIRCEGATAEMWIDGAVPIGAPSHLGVVVGATSKVYHKNFLPIRSTIGGNGSFTEYTS